MCYNCFAPHTHVTCAVDSTSKMRMSVSRKYRVNAIHSTSRVEDDLEAQDDRLYITSASIVASVSLFLTCSPFAAVCLCGVAGLAQTFPSLTVSGPFLPDAPRFHVPPDRILPWFHLNFGLPLGRFPSIFISTTALIFSVSSLLLTWPNHPSLLLLITVAICSTFASSKISSFLRCSNRLTPIRPTRRTILISVVVIRLSSVGVELYRGRYVD